MIKTLSELLKPYEVSWMTLDAEYGALLRLVKIQIGVVPDSDPMLAIWPNGYDSYNILVPGFLNLPKLLFSKKSNKSAVGLAMYAASYTTGCTYCTSHTCSFALRRGLSPEALVGAKTPQQEAVIAFAKSLATSPSTLTKHHLSELRKYYPEEIVQTIAMSICMMGFLSKYMSTIDLDIEEECVSETAKLIIEADPNAEISALLRAKYGIPDNLKSIRPDNFLTYLKVILAAPGALKFEGKHLKKVPTKAAEASAYLKEKIGYALPIVNKIKQGQVIRALTAVLAMNLNPEKTRTGLRIKYIVNLVFAKVTNNFFLLEQAYALIKQNNLQISSDTLNILEIAALKDLNQSRNSYHVFMSDLVSDTNELSREEALYVLFTKLTALTPNGINPVVVQEIGRSELDAQKIIEITTWISILQMLNILYTYFDRTS